MKELTYTAVHLKNGHTIYTARPVSQILGELDIDSGICGVRIQGLDGQEYNVTASSVALVHESTPESRSFLYRLGFELNHEKGIVQQEQMRVLQQAMDEEMRKQEQKNRADKVAGGIGRKDA